MTRSSRPPRVARDTAWFLAAHAVYKITGAVVLGAAARAITPGELGAFFYGRAVADQLAPLATMGSLEVTRRRIATDHDPGPLHALLGLRVVLGIAYMAAAIFVALVSRSGTWRVVVALAVVGLADTTAGMVTGLLQARRRAGLALAVGMATQAVFVGTCLAVLHWAPSLEAYVGAWVVRGAVLVALGIAALHHVFGPLRVRWDPTILRESLPFLAAQLSRAASSSAMPLLIGVIGRYQEVARYGMGAFILTAASVIPSIMGSVLYPEIARLGVTSQTRRWFFERTALLLLGSLVGSAIMALGADLLADVLYGSGGVGVPPVLRLLSLALPMTLLNPFMQSILQALGRERTAAIAGAVLVLVTLGVAVGLIPGHGAGGAAIAAVCGLATQGGVLALGLLRLGLLSPQMTAKVERRDD